MKIFTTVIVILLAGATSATAERGPVLNCARYHAGTPVGDGEYTDGALLKAHGIGCRSALALVKPRYRWVIRRESRAVIHARQIPPVRLGKFRCHYSTDGPVALKTCMARGAWFTFI